MVLSNFLRIQGVYDILFVLIIIIGTTFSGYGQLAGPISCNDSGVPAFNINPCNQGTFIGSDISTRDNNFNLIATVNQTDIGGSGEVLVNDGFEFCDMNGGVTGDSEGPDILFNIPVDPSKRMSCEAGVLTITLRGDFNNTCEVAYIVNECDIIIAQSELTGLPENDKCDIIFPLSVNIPAADLTEAAADGMISFFVRTNGQTPGLQGSEVDATCAGFRGVDCDADGVLDGNCIALESFIWPIQNTAEAGTLNSTDNFLCAGECLDIDVLGDLMFDDPIGSGTDADGNPMTGSYHLDFYFGGGPNPANPYPSDGGTAGDLINVYDASTGSNPQVQICNTGVGTQDHMNTNAPLSSGGGSLPTNTLIEVLGSVWGDNNVEPVGVGSCFGDIVNCGENTNYISFVILEPIEAEFECLGCAEGPGDDTNIGIVQISGFSGGQPGFDASLYTLGTTGGTLSSTSVDENGVVTLTLDPNQHSWSVTIMDDQGCEIILNGTCGIEEDPKIHIPSFTCIETGPIEVEVKPEGGLLFGPGVTGTTFDPVAAGVGIHELEYFFREDGCQVIAKQVIQVGNCQGCDDLVCPENVVLECAVEPDLGEPITGNLQWTHNANGGTSYAGDNNSNGLISSVMDITFGPGVTLLDNNGNPAVIPNGSTFEHILTDVQTTTAAAAIADGDYAELCFTVAQKSTLTGIFESIFPGGPGGGAADFQVTTEISADGFASATTLFMNATLASGPFNYFQATNFALNAGTNYCVRFYLYNEQNNFNPDNTVSFDDVTIDVQECPIDPNLAAFLNGFSASDECGTVMSEVVFSIDDCGNAVTELYQFTATDEAGNQTSCFASYSIVDTTPPILDPIEDLVINCSDLIPADDGDGGDDGDPCEGCLVSQLAEQGNQFFANFQLQVFNTCDFATPSNITAVITGANYSLPNINGFNGVTHVETGTAPNITHTFTIPPLGAFNQNINIQANGLPNVVVTGNGGVPVSAGVTTLTCGGTVGGDPGDDDSSIIHVWLNSATASDICGEVDIKSDFIGIADADFCVDGEYQQKVIFTATDDCGNMVQDSAFIIVQDNEPPMMMAPEDLTIPCTDLGTTATSISSWLASVTAEDICDPDIIVTNDFTVFNFDLCTSMTIPVTWTATDDCGNTTTVTANLVIEGDNAAPLFVFTPAPLMIDCESGDITLGNWLNSAGAEDACDPDVTITNDYSATEIDICSGGGSATVTWTATDVCGNSSTTTSTITVTPDMTPPTMVAPADLTLPCTDLETTTTSISTWLASVTASDLCDPDIIVTNNFSTFNNDLCSASTTTVTWTAIDDCGNTTTVMADLIIEGDLIPPTVTPPANLTLSCDDINETAEASALITQFLNGATATDDCDSDPVITFTGAEGIDICMGSATVITWTATDNCGNMSTAAATITIIPDAQPPMLTVPANITLTCDDINETAEASALISEFLNGATATDNCDTDPVITFEGAEGLDICMGSATTITWTAVDQCGNMTTAAATITIIPDAQPPTLTVPANITLTCDDINETADASALITEFLNGATATDNCDTDPVITFEGAEGLDICMGSATTITWTAVDQCGNMTTAAATITIIPDAQPPTLTVPANITLTCDDINETADASALITEFLNGATATDNCDTDPVITFEGAEGLDICMGSATTITWTAVDQCGNMTTAAATITIIPDAQPPTLTVPANITLTCDDINETADASALITEFLNGATATDNCDTDPVITFEGAEGLDICMGSATTITWTAVDQCGNMTTAAATITIIPDAQPPILTVPSNITLSCADINGTSDASALITEFLNGATATDNCDTDPVITFEGAEGLDICMGGATTITWTAVDQCGNMTTATATITIIPDAQPPVMVAPANLTLPCTDLETTTTSISTWLANVTASDICDSDIIVTNNFTGFNLDLCTQGTTTVTWTAIDDCGNTTTVMADLIIEGDDVPPLFIVTPMPLDIDCMSGDVTLGNWLNSAIASDACDPDITITNDYTPTAIDICNGGGSATVTWTATDACGNSSTTTSTITVTPDETPPVMVAPADLTLPCTDLETTTSSISSWLASVTASDLCDPDVIVTNDFTTFNVDLCTNSTTTVTWSAIDDCGNTTTVMADLNIEGDDVPPVFTVTPMPLDIDCMSGDVTLGNWLNSAVAVDACDPDITITNDYTPTAIDICNGGGSATVTWTATDACGNSSTTTSIITVTPDETPPIMVAPADLTLPCTDLETTTSSISSWLASVTASDLCDPDVIVTNDFTTFNVDLCTNSTTTVTWSAIDDCGNTTTVMADLIIEGDDVPPVFTVTPMPLDIDCMSGDVTLGNWLNSVVAVDACDPDITITNDYTPTAIDICNGGGSATVTWTATDACGNSSTTTSIITVTPDETPPIMVAPTDLTLPCTDLETTTSSISSWLASVTASDLCDPDVLVSNDFTTFNVDLCTNSTTTVTWTAIDDCGNTTVVTADLIIEGDDTPPVFTLTPMPITIDCNNPNASIGAFLNGAVAVDACDPDITITNDFSATNFDICGAGGITTITFTATDACGNSSTTTSTITVTPDETPPVMVAPADLTLPCTDLETTTSSISSWLASVTASDLCDPDVIVTNDFTTFNVDLCTNSTTTVTWSAIDDCGNTTTVMADLIIEGDDVPPVFTVTPMPLDIDCMSGDVTLGNWLNSAVAVDACDPDITITNDYTPTAIDICNGGGSATVTWTATDACGNSSTTTSIITVTPDETPPIMVAPADLTLPCTDLETTTSSISSWLASVTASDLCDPDVIVTNDFTTFNVDLCTNSTTTVTWSAIDDCGNTTTVMADLIIEGDDVPPVFTVTPMPLDIDCMSGDVTLGNWLNSAVAVDACDPDITITNDYTPTAIDICNGGGSATVTWTATDACGNSSTTTSTITVTPDETPPVMVAPADLTLPCTDLETTTTSISSWLASVTASDACDPDVIVTNDFTTFNVDLCTNTTTTVTWTAIDDCGNTTMVMADVIIEGDDTPPIFIVTPAPLDIDCDSGDVTLGNWLNSAVASDECDPDITITNDYSPTAIDICNGGGSATVTWTATDACGNSSTTTSTITVTPDETPPVMVAPADLTLPCTDLETTTTSISSWLASVTASDACDPDVIVTNDFTTFNVDLCTNTTTTVTWTAIDDCGNTTSVTADVIVEGDDTPPVFTFMPASIEIDCMNGNTTLGNFLNGAIAVDDCDPDITITTDFSATNFDICGIGGTTTITFTATDACGNSSTATSTITVTPDETPPVITAPADLTLPCTDLETTTTSISSWLASVTSSDICDPNVLVVNDFTTFNLDLCTNSTTTITWTAIDDCGNTTSVMADLIIEGDDAPPVFTITPPALDINCMSGDVTLGNWLNSAVAVDACDPDITITNDYTPTAIDICNGGGSATITWTATDACGNSSTTTSTITVTPDETAPVMVAPTDLTLPCTDLETTTSSISSWLASVTASDLCDPDVIVTNDYAGFNVDLCANSTTTVTWTAIDDCGNTTIVMADLIIEGDDTPPVFTVTPPALDIDCMSGDVTLGNWLNSAVAVDACDPDITITNDYTPTAIDICNGGGSATVIWTATDACGNSSTTTSTITVTPDETAPVMVAPADLTLPCTDLETTTSSISSWLASVTASDLCDPDVIVTNDYAGFNVDLCTNSTTTVTWTAIDDCGNTTIVMADLIIEGDDVPPVFTVTPPALDIDCMSGDVTLGNWLNSAVAVDACDPDITITNDYTPTAIDICNGGGSATITWTATDACGNSSTTTSTITVTPDETAPVMVAPADLTLPCTDLETTTSSISSWLASVTASDLCDPDVIVTNDYAGFNVDLCTNSTTTVTWTAIDDCGNTTIVMADLIIEGDDVPPVFTVTPPALDIDCMSGDVTLGNWLNSAVAVDACDPDITITNDYTPTAIDICNGGGSATVTWTATDACGNSSTTTSTITVTPDETAPVMVAPADLTLPCTDLETTTSSISSWLASVTASDLCDPDVIVTNDYAGFNVDLCTNSTTTVTWTAIDDCGNTTIVMADLIIEGDDVPPVFTVTPPALDIDCMSGDVTLGNWLNSAVAVDACDPDITITNDYTPTAIDICNGGGSATITWTATDACGNSSTTTSTITVTPDETAPVMVAPADLTLPCTDLETTTSSISSWLASVTASDLCDPDVIVTNDYAGFNVDLCTNSTTTVTWTAIDDCGNTTIVMADLIIEGDDVPPVFTVTPPALDIDCMSGDVTLGNWLNSAVAVDACDPDITITNDYTPTAIDICNGGGSATVTWTATDACGNSSTTTSTITVTPDETAPVMVAPADLTLPCTDLETTTSSISSWLASVTASDLCDPDVIVTNDYAGFNVDLCTNSTTTVTWTAIDDCGNTTIVMADLIIEGDDMPPVFTVIPTPINIDCNNPNVSIGVFLNSAVAVDACDPDITITNDFSPTNFDICGAGGTTTITFTATDACGNSSTTTSTITVTPDETAPVIVAPANLTLPCTDLETTTSSISSWLASVSASDICDPDVLVTNDFTTFNLDLCTNSTTTITWTAIDDCGNTTSVMADLIIEGDDTPPVFTVTPAALDIDCMSGDVTLGNWLNSAVAVDACDPDITITNDYTPTAIDICNGGGSATITWTATDACGNSSTTSSTITVTPDDTPPVMVAPTDLTLPCTDLETTTSSISSWLASVTASDLCDPDVIVTNDYAGFNVDLCTNSTTTVTWTAIDDCGNTTTVMADVIIEGDDTPPVFTVTPPALDIDCMSGDVTLGNWLNSAVAVDACDPDITITNDYTPTAIDICNGGGSATVTWTATDACGNSSTTSSTIIVTPDETPPVMVAPADLTIPCSDLETTTSSISSWLASVTASDSCDPDVIVTNDYTAFNVDLCSNSTTTVTWIAIDDCGNTTIVMADLIIEGDDTPPVFTVTPPALDIDCMSGDVTLGNWLNSAVAVDACDPDISITNDYTPTAIDICNGGGSATITWTATDACGNSSTTSSTITVTPDDTPPVMVAPADLTLPCTDLETTTSSISSWLASVTASDLCDPDVIVTNDYATFNVDLCTNSTTTVTWTATDDCGNTTIVMADVIIEGDDTPPVFTFTPPDLDIDCSSGDITIGNWLNSAVAIDACDPDISITNNFSATNLDICGAGGTTIVTFTATDACGNSSTTTSMITVTPDVTPPVLVAPSNLTLPCSDLETTASSISSWLASVTASDVCDTDVLVTNDFTSFNLDLCTNLTTTITWTAIDDCGNTTTVTADLIIEGDDDSPVFTFTPPSLNFDCSDINETEQVTLSGWLDSAIALDNCDSDIVITNDYTQTSLDICNGGGTTTVTWTATDACGNFTTTFSTITITEDNTPPVIVAPMPIVIDCTNLSETADPAVLINAFLSDASVSDICDTDPVLTHNFDITLLDVCADASYMITVTWNALDACNNAAIPVTSTITVNPDTEAPVITIPPTNIQIDCSILNSTFDPSQMLDSLMSVIQIVDNCDTDPVITNDFNVNDLTMCSGDEFDITVTFTATDACNNTSTATTIITVTPDNDVPVITCPANTIDNTEFFDCEGDLSWEHPMPTDDCGIVVYTYTITDPDGTINGPFDLRGILNADNFETTFDFEEGVSVVSYLVEDFCGNRTECSFEVTVGDNLNPFFLDCPSDLFVGNDPDECSAKVNWDIPIAVDNCDAPADPDVIEMDTSLVVTQLTGMHNGLTFDDIQSGDVIPVGNYLIGYLVVDTDGNTDTCQFNLTVWDTQDPILIAAIPFDITLSCEMPLDTFVLQSHQVMDNCVENPTVENILISNRVMDPNDPGYSNYQDTFLYTVIDSAQILPDGSVKVNQMTWKWVVNWIDTIAPVLSLDFPSILLEECNLEETEVCRDEEIIIGQKDSTVFVNDQWVIATIVLKDTIQICDTIFQPIPFDEQLLAQGATAVDACHPSDDFQLVSLDDFLNSTEGFLLTFVDERTEECKGDKAFTIERTWFATDPSGNVDSIVQIIEVLDRNPPEISCREEITVSLDEDGTFNLTRDDVLFDYFDACFTDPDDIEVLIQPNFFNCQDIGTHDVLVSATDICNNRTAYCEVTVNVIDIIAPTILCPQTPVVISVNPRNCDTAFDIGSYVLSEDCDVTIMTDPPINGGLPEGLSMVAITATDASGNANTCTIQVDVQLTEQIEFDVTLGCNNLLNVSLPSDCELTLTPDMILEGDPNVCSDLLCIEVNDDQGVAHINFFDISDVDQVFQVRIVDCNGSGNSCWASVRIEEKQIPIIEYPRDTSILCLEPQEPEYHKLGFPTILNCESGVDIRFIDNYIEFDQCEDPRAIIERTWIVTDDDAIANRDTHTQIITINPFSNEHVTFPDDITAANAIACEDVTETLDDIENGILNSGSNLHPDSTGLPTAFGIPLLTNAGLCLFNVGYEDEVLEGCGATFSILRTWRILDICQGSSPTNPIEHTQIIVILDSKAPEIVNDSIELTVSMDPWTCVWSGSLPIPEITETCGSTSIDGYVSGGGFIEIENQNNALTVTGFNFGLGVHTVNFAIQDACGNISLFDYDVTVIDDIKPVAICKENLQVVLTNDNAGGTGKLFTSDIDAGSNDAGCSKISTCLIRLVDFNGGLLDTLIDGQQVYHANNGCNFDGEFRDTVADKNGVIDSIVTIQYVLCQDFIELCCVDEGDLEVALITTDENGLSNSCTTIVRVVDSSASSLNCEPQTIDCSDDSSVNVLSPLGDQTFCGENVNLEFIDDSVFRDNCGEGQIFRIWYLDSNQNQTLDEGETSCNQVVTILNSNPLDPNTIKWPRHYTGEIVDGINLECDEDGNVFSEDTPVAMGDVFTCSASEFGIPVWCDSDCGLVGLSSEIDTVAASDACLQLINRWTIIDWCTWDANDENNTDNGDSFEAVEDWAQGVCTGCIEGISDNPVYFRYDSVTADGSYSFEQIIKIIDDVAPTIEIADLIVSVTGGRTSKEDDQICIGTGQLTIVASDFCGEQEVATDGLSWSIEYDDGQSIETSSFVGGTLVLDTEPGSLGESHTVTVTVRDGCGNQSTASADITFVDETAPVPICVSGVTTVFAESNGTVDVWAVDFDLGSFDNCSDLRFTIVQDGEQPLRPGEDGFDMQQLITFSCLDSLDQFELDVWMWDADANGAFCSVSILIGGDCENTSTSSFISGSVQTYVNEPVESVEILLNANLAEYPKTWVTSFSGEYAFDLNPNSLNYLLSARRTDNPLNGVSTQDLILIQQHVVGFIPLESPYLLIAADVNNNQNISAVDILELRKMILGLEPEFSQNESWRFVSKKFQFIDDEYPWPFNEEINIASLSANIVNQDFIGVKIGDVSGDAIPNSLISNEIRSNNLMILQSDANQFKKGELVKIPIYSDDMNDIGGFQMTLLHSNLTFSSIESSNIVITDEHIGIHEDQLTFSWNGEVNDQEGPLFYLHFVATENGKLSESLNINSSITKAEAYKRDEILNVALEFNNAVADQIKVFQNNPNPFSAKSEIQFNLPTKETIELILYDIDGKVLHSVEDAFEKGSHTITINRNDLPVSGVVYYQLRAGSFVSKTFKAVIID